jgi:hypothetical protein
MKNGNATSSSKALALSATLTVLVLAACRAPTHQTSVAPGWPNDPEYGVAVDIRALGSALWHYEDEMRELRASCGATTNAALRARTTAGRERVYPTKQYLRDVRHCLEVLRRRGRALLEESHAYMRESVMGGHANEQPAEGDRK